MKHGSETKTGHSGQRHMTTKPKKGRYVAKNTMGTGKSKMKVRGAMGKHQETGKGGA